MRVCESYCGFSRVIESSCELLGGEHIEMEAYPRHVQVAAADIGLLPGASNGLSTPYTRPDYGARESSPVLSSAMGIMYR